MGHFRGNHNPQAESCRTHGAECLELMDAALRALDSYSGTLAKPLVAIPDFGILGQPPAFILSRAARISPDKGPEVT